ncbi:CAP10 domain-containing protein [Mycena indigotica]|uniref:CAP10 domain-containing protein n=1 Tax=Mycena indigotica TaxID=2126181 RepID=A0A8H6RWC5_9AGAR|nr:CAP10 domain-containing protein [Mycena indigotica]KAF7288995.1 CAP10 domain-containing protein [Mycena indigotica]
MRAFLQRLNPRAYFAGSSAPDTTPYELVPESEEELGDSIPLLPSSSTQSLDKQLEQIAPRRRRRKDYQCASPALFAGIALGGLFAAVVVLCVLLFLRQPPEEHIPPPPPPPPPVSNTDMSDPILAARAHVAALRARQPQTLVHAASRYSLKTGRSPPRNYDLWFQFAREHGCLVDEYDQIYRDFKPFYQLAERDPIFFQRMIDAASKMMANDAKEMGRYEIKNGKVIRPEGKPTSYWDTEPLTLGWFSHILPDLTVIINGKDEPRVVFDVRQTGDAIRDRALKLTEQNPFEVSPHPTYTYFYNKPGCTIMRSKDGFPDVANDDSAFFLSSAKTQWTEDLYPILSMTKVSPCFADILFPIEYYYTRSWWSRKFGHENNIAWNDKQEKIYWRGTASGGQIFDDNWRNFTRFKLVDKSHAHPDLLDAEITTFADELCMGRPECHRDQIMAEYKITGALTPKENAYKHKYLLDVDGMTFSGRFLGLLRSGSLVFKMTVFEEYFNEWLRPYEHYIPVAPDLSDLFEKLAWAKEHDAEARMIQERGKAVAGGIVTDGQNDCYFALVLLEWARLQEIARNATAGHH